MCRLLILRSNRVRKQDSKGAPSRLDGPQLEARLAQQRLPVLLQMGGHLQSLSLSRTE